MGYKENLLNIYKNIKEVKLKYLDFPKLNILKFFTQSTLEGGACFNTFFFYKIIVANKLF